MKMLFSPFVVQDVLESLPNKERFNHALLNADPGEVS
jgi:hypothetical protein